jgi:hypothetical protein
MSARTFDAVALLIDEWRAALDAAQLVLEAEIYLRSLT